MKKLTFRTALAALLLATPFSHLFSQISVSSSSGYNVNIVILPTQVLPSTYSCPWGYNYNLKVSYVVTFTGSYSPGYINTLQGTIGCLGGNSHFFSLPLNGGVGTITTTSNQWNGATDCATATVTSLLCNSAQITVRGVGVNTVVNYPITYIALPVQLVGFTATPQDNKVKLSWSTATEINNEYFTIERSADSWLGQEQKRINGAGNSIDWHSYEWIDEAALAGKSYYRLKQTDIDGHITYSEVKSVQMEKGGGNINVFPVPNSGNTITLTGLSDYNNHKLTVINSAGAGVFATALSSSSVTLPELVPGIYIIRVSDERTGKSTHIRYIKL